MRHNAGAHARRIENPSKWVFIISGSIILAVIFAAMMIAIL